MVVYNTAISTYNRASNSVNKIDNPNQMPSNFIIPDLYKTIVNEAKSSFIFGTASAISKDFFNTEKNFISKNITAIKKGIEHLENAVLYNFLSFLGRQLRIKRTISHPICIAICSYMNGRRNGKIFALKSSLFCLLTNLIYSFTFLNG